MKEGSESAVQELEQDPTQDEAGPARAADSNASDAAPIDSGTAAADPMAAEAASPAGPESPDDADEPTPELASTPDGSLPEAGGAPEGAPEGEPSQEGDGAEAEENEGEDPATDDELIAQVSALVFASPDPVGVPRIAKLLGTTRARVKTALARISERLEQAGLGFGLRGLAGGATFMTHPALGEVVASLSKQAAVERISPAALETLSVVAYRGPVTKAEIEAIRGVQAGPMLRSLVDRGLVRVVGRSDEPGHALQYGTTKEFLSRFGLESLADLPRDGELARD